MKFCFVSEVFPYRRGERLVIPGGGEAHAFFLSRELVRRRHEGTTVASGLIFWTLIKQGMSQCAY